MAPLTTGAYRLTGPDGPYAVESFVLAADGGGGWTYDATRSDPATAARLGRLWLQVDAGGTTTRLHVEAGGWVLRGGCVGPDVLWRRGPDEHEAVAEGFTGTSPAYAAATAQRLALEVGATRRVRLVAVTEPALATRLVDESWTRTAPDRWAVTDLATGERREVRVAGGLVVEGSGLALTRS